MLRLNFLLTVIAIGFSLLVQYFSRAMIRHSHFELFRDRVSEGDRDLILNTAGGVVWIALLPLLVTNIAWLIIEYRTVATEEPVNRGASSNS